MLSALELLTSVGVILFSSVLYEILHTWTSLVYLVNNRDHIYGKVRPEGILIIDPTVVLTLSVLVLTYMYVRVYVTPP